MEAYSLAFNLATIHFAGRNGYFMTPFLKSDGHSEVRVQITQRTEQGHHNLFAHAVPPAKSGSGRLQDGGS